MELLDSLLQLFGARAAFHWVFTLLLRARSALALGAERTFAGAFLCGWLAAAGETRRRPGAITHRHCMHAFPRGRLFRREVELEEAEWNGWVIGITRQRRGMSDPSHADPFQSLPHDPLGTQNKLFAAYPSLSASPPTPVHPFFSLHGAQSLTNFEPLLWPAASICTEEYERSTAGNHSRGSESRPRSWVIARTITKKVEMSRLGYYEGLAHSTPLGPKTDVAHNVPT
ncbi:hypothetical protein MKEN_01351100 [Mycena kentingensis (nom. inval.)]|nr:hypothetical protein MKEN_01351100 [Mycena kentingensis (nom. inval.)]